MSLHIKYRPVSLNEIRGNADTISILEGMLSDIETCPHSFLFFGESGTGKTTLARILADRLGCKGNDYKEINTADFRGIDTIREIISNSQFKPLEGDCRVWVLDEIHKATGEAQNALLKILEDTPRHVFFILCTTDPQKLLATIKGRCSQFQTKPLSEAQMYGLLRKIVKEENETLEREVFDQVIQDSLGHPRNALQILEQVFKVAPDRRIEIAKQAAIEQSQVIELCRALIKGSNWNIIKKILNGLKDQQAESIRRSLLGYSQNTLLKEENDRAALIIEQLWDPLYDTGWPGLTYCVYSITKNK